MMKVQQLISLFIGIIIFGCTHQCIGEEIVILGNDSKPPKFYLEDNKAKGIFIDIMQYIDKDMPQSFKYELFPWKRAYLYAKQGKGGIIGFSMNNERLAIFDYSDVMYYDTLVLVVLKGNEFPFNNIDDLQGKKIGVLRGASYGEEFEKTKNNIFIIDEDNSGEQRLLKLLLKRIDIALLGPGKAGFNSVIKGNKTLTERKDEFVILSKPFYRDPNYLGFAKTMNMQSFLQEFNKILKKGYKSGAIQKIIDNYSN